MPRFITNQFLSILKKINLKEKKILIFGATFKENCNDIRNSKSIELARILKRKRFNVDFFDPFVKKSYIENFKNLKNLKKIKNKFYSAFFFNVRHKHFIKIDIDMLRRKLKSNGIIMDIKNIFPSSKTDFCL